MFTGGDAEGIALAAPEGDLLHHGAWTRASTAQCWTTWCATRPVAGAASGWRA
jgi:hypothetical protein